MKGLFALVFVLGMLGAIGCAAVTGLFTWGGHRVQKRTLFALSLAIIFTVTIFGFNPPSLEAWVTILTFGLLLGTLLFLIAKLSFDRNLVGSELMLSPSVRWRNWVTSFGVVLLCNLLFRTEMGEHAMELQWPLQGFVIGFLVSSISMYLYVYGKEVKLGKPIVEKVRAYNQTRDADETK
jgi:hypothetical protein